MIVRLSEIIENIPCHFCDHKSLNIMSPQMQGSKISVYVSCDNCREKDVLRLDLKDYAKEDILTAEKFAEELGSKVDE